MSDVQARIKEIVERNPIVVFAKGTKEQPMCGFSAATIDVFRALGVPFEVVDVIGNPEYREEIKAFTNWPTIPQVFVGGEFIGGCDITREMYESGDLQKKVAALGQPAKR